MSTFLVKIKKCSHKILSEKLFLIKRAYFYCYKCGKLILVKNLKMYESITDEKFEYNPTKIINQMLSNQESTNSNKSSYISNYYIKNRDKFINFIKQYCLKLNYNKKIFYACLHLIDNYLIHELKKEISKREIALITLGFFLVALKFNENDIFEPKLDKFYKIGNDIILSKSEIINSEIKALKIMDYNVINYSVFDWIEVLNKVGYIFDNKFNKLKIELIQDNQKLLLRRILHSNILYRYDSFQIALSIIHISMANIFNIDKKSKELYFLFLSIFSKKFSDYKSCYIDIKTYIFNDYNRGRNEDEKSGFNFTLKEKDKNNNSFKLKFLLNSSKLKSNENIKRIFSLKKNKKNEEYKKASIIDNYLSKIKTTEKKLESYNNKNSKDLFFSSYSINNNHLTIDCTNNNIDSNNNISNLHKNQINFRLNNEANYLLKKSKTLLNNNLNENNENKKNEQENNDKNLLAKNQEIKIKNKHILEKIGIKIKKENEENIEFIYNNKIKYLILNKEKFINLKKGKNIIIHKNSNNNNYFKRNKTIDVIKINRNNNIFPKFNN